MSRKQPLDLRFYQRRASEAVLTPLRSPGRVEAPEGTWGVEAKALYRAGWEYVERRGLRIWCQDAADPWQGWKSEDVAYEMLGKES